MVLINQDVLEGYHRFEFMTEETIRPSPGDALETNMEKRGLTHSVHADSMEPQIGKPLLYATTAKYLWDTTQTLYSKRQNATRLYALRKQVHNCKQGTLDVTSYLNKLSLLWQEMDLCRLNPKFDIVCGHILGQRPLPEKTGPQLQTRDPRRDFLSQ
ncbi:Beta-galactosidase [Cucumis melo var. makuwa]|uniref:Beta-galactosidase n=1 Tax=Cucumis melo var. makuwa TaxID=1194695 RepID=A0A5A7T4M4_CUCMM|nr:Beta-galactosidase [Cucumis melo var. makuwa]